MTRTCERTARGIALIKPLLDSSQIFTRAEKHASCSAKIKDLLTIYYGRPPPILHYQCWTFSYILTNVAGEGGGGREEGILSALRFLTVFFQGSKRIFRDCWNRLWMCELSIS